MRQDLTVPKFPPLWKLLSLQKILSRLRSEVRKLRGREVERLRRDPIKHARVQIDKVRGKLLSLGFTDEPLEELTGLMQASANPAVRCFAARELALWNMRAGTPEGYLATLDYLAIARRDAPDLDARSKLVTIELLCNFLLGQMTEGHAVYEGAALAGEMSADALLAWSNFQADAEARLIWLNHVLHRYGIAKIALLPDASRPIYDRLTSARPLPSVSEGPKVTVLMAAYDAADVIDTALRSLREQTWQNLEILVLDDCSPSENMAAVVARFAEQDARIRLIRMPVNGGAYVARNRGLDEATGEFVTIHDADDWSHPQKIERQASYLVHNPAVIGCTSEQARTFDDLSFRKLRAGGAFITFNTSSFMFRRGPVREALGYWDTVRFGADNEFIRRIQKLFGTKSVSKLRTGPLSFQRDTSTSVTSDSVKGIGWSHHYYGVRRAYFDAQSHHHQTAADLRYSGDPDLRPFPVPPMMLPKQPGPTSPFDIVFAGDFRQLTPEVVQLCERIRTLRGKGQRVGLVETYEYARSLDVQVGACAEIRELVDGDQVRILVYGEEVEATALERIGTGADLAKLRFVPKIHIVSAV